jgi:hypothetical protein
MAWLLDWSRHEQATVDSVGCRVPKACASATLVTSGGRGSDGIGPQNRPRCICIQVVIDLVIRTTCADGHLALRERTSNPGTGVKSDPVSGCVTTSRTIEVSLHCPCQPYRFQRSWRWLN